MIFSSFKKGLDQKKKIKIKKNWEFVVSNFLFFGQFVDF